MGLTKDCSLAIVLGFLNLLVVPLILGDSWEQKKAYSLFFQTQ